MIASVGNAPFFLIDAYNFLHAVLLKGRSRDEFWAKERVSELASYFDRRREEFLVVLDSKKERDSIEVARPWLVRAPDADRELLRILRERRVSPTFDLLLTSRPLVLVTADRSLGDRARLLGAELESPWDFSARASGDSDQ